MNPQAFALTGVTAAVRLLFLWLRPFDAVSWDVRSWEKVLAVLHRHGNPYVDTPFLNWPSPWMIALRAIDYAANVAGLHFRTVLFGTLIVFDCLLALAVFFALTNLVRSRHAFLATLVGIALSPVLLLLSAQHGNFDAIPALFMLLSLLVLQFAEKQASQTWWLVSVALLAVAVVCKTFPLILAPLVFAAGFHRRERHVTLLGGALLLGPITLSIGTLFALQPWGVLSHVLFYRSTPQDYGLQMLLHSYSGVRQVLHQAAFALVMIAGSLWVIAFIVQRRSPTLRQILLAGAALLLLPMAFGTGFGTQYVLWVWPILVVLYPMLPGGQRAILHAAHAAIALGFVVIYGLVSRRNYYGGLLEDLALTSPSAELDAVMVRWAFGAIYISILAVFACVASALWKESAGFTPDGRRDLPIPDAS